MVVKETVRTVSAVRVPLFHRCSKSRSIQAERYTQFFRSIGRDDKAAGFQKLQRVVEICFPEDRIGGLLLERIVRDLKALGGVALRPD